MPCPQFQRYVAIGDSQTEGLHDYHDDGLPRGWADRFAEFVAAHNPDLLYANLAVRGKTVGQVKADQLAPAVDLDPDLITVVGGVNDAVRPGTDMRAVGNDLEHMYATLAKEGRTIMGCTLPLPTVGLTQKVTPRLVELNACIRAAAERHGVLIVELEDIRAASDLRLWSPDRIHLNPDGHRRLAAGFADRLSGEGDEQWKEPLPPIPEPSRPLQVASEAAWIARFMVPKIFRLVRGRSSGDGRSAKRPVLTPVR